jgi:hypothetical protein
MNQRASFPIVQAGGPAELFPTPPFLHLFFRLGRAAGLHNKSALPALSNELTTLFDFKSGRGPPGDRRREGPC